MRVCPRCAADNVDEARYCTRCGLALDGAPGLDIPERRRGVIVLAAAIALVVGAGSLASWFVSRTDPCAEKLSSATYPYCVTLPEGWRLGSQEVGGVTADAFQDLNRSSVVLVVAERVEGGIGSKDYAELHRRNQERDGFDPGPSRRVAVAGVDGVAWEVMATTGGGTAVHQRQLALVRGRSGWVITLAGPEDRYDEVREDFEKMIGSWMWR